MYIPKSQRNTPTVSSIFGVSKPNSIKSSDDGIPQSFISKTPGFAMYSPKIKEYIRKCFAPCTEQSDIDSVSDGIIKKISSVAAGKMLHIYNWEIEPPIIPKAPSVTKPKTVTASTNSWVNIGKPVLKNKQVFDSGFITQVQVPLNSAVNESLKKEMESHPLLSLTNQEEKVGKQLVVKKEPKVENKPILISEPKTEKKSKMTEKLKKIGKMNCDIDSVVIEKKAPVSKNPEKPKKTQKEIEKQTVSVIIPPKKEKVNNKVEPPTLNVQKKVSLLDQSLSSIVELKKKGGKKSRETNDVSTNLNFNTQISTSSENPVQMTVIGKSQSLEKQYLRLTGDANPDMIRPLPVLKNSLEYCLSKFNQNNEYEYIRDQLRSIRQDLTVQHIEDEFCAEVYEKTIFLSIEHKDWDNFNQSLSPLEVLYENGFGKDSNKEMIRAFKLIYLVGVNDKFGLYSYIPKLQKRDLEAPMVQIALKIWSYVSQRAWISFFELYKTVDHLTKNIMSIAADYIRKIAVNTISSAMRLCSINDYTALLYFDTMDDTVQYLANNSIPLPLIN